MTFFRIHSRKAGRSRSAGEEKLPYRSSLAKFDGDLSLFRVNTVALKAWLPKTVDEILKQLSDHWPDSRSEIIRETLFVYVYGQYAFAQMRAENEGFFYVDPNAPKFSRTRTTHPELGKSIKSYKVWMPAKLRDDLKILTEQHSMTLSHYAREILISSFMGHLKLTSRESVIRQAREQPDDWPPEADDSEDFT